MSPAPVWVPRVVISSFFHEFNATCCIFMARINSLVITEYTSGKEIYKKSNNSNNARFPPLGTRVQSVLPRFHFSNLASFAWCVPLMVHAHKVVSLLLQLFVSNRKVWEIYFKISIFLHQCVVDLYLISFNMYFVLRWVSQFKFLDER